MEGFFPQEQYPDLLLGLSSGDDAAVYRLSDAAALIFTLDFFTPIVDSPYEYGRIAAANAMSDVYAMGGDVALALNICAFPSSLSNDIFSGIITGGADAVKEAGGILAGGHTISDAEPKYGLAVIGFCHPDRVLAKTGAQDSDVLVLTKPLGTGVITTAAKQGAAADVHVDGAVSSMMRLNKGASKILRSLPASSCTDVTGFSLIGHAWEIADHSKVTLCIDYDALPFLDGAVKYAQNSIFPGGAYKNRRWYEPKVEWKHSLEEYQKTLLCTPETSGGLLAAVAKHQVEELIERSAAENVSVHVIGRVESSGKKDIVIL